MAAKGSFWKYLKTAFSWHWNLLALGAGVAAAILSGKADMVLPLLAAVEIAYLGLLTTNPKFRKSVDAKSVSTTALDQRDKQLKRIMASLTHQDLARFESLRTRCTTLQRLGQQFRGFGTETNSSGSLDDLHLASLDRLLWMFLKLLYSKDALSRFLKHTHRDKLVEEIKTTEKRLLGIQETDRRRNLVRSLEDKLNTMGERLRNYDAAVENYELIQAELERIEQKLTAVSEMSLSSSDPASLSAQVDGITDSISVTAEAIRSLDMVPDIEYDEAPALLREEEG